MKDGTGWLQSVGLLWLRVLMGSGIAYHGYQKIFGGYIPKFAEGVAQMGFPMPVVFAWAAALSEFLGGILIAVGLVTRLSALAVFLTMSVAVFIHHAQDPLGVKELALAYWTMAGALIFTGGGGVALDRLFRGKHR